MVVAVVMAVIMVVIVVMVVVGFGGCCGNGRTMVMDRALSLSPLEITPVRGVTVANASAMVSSGGGSSSSVNPSRVAWCERG